MIRFTVAGRPIAQPRHRVGAVRFGGGRGRAYIPKAHAVHAFKAAVRLAARIALAGRQPLAVPVIVELTFLLPRPRRLGRGARWPAGVKPDAENLAKGVLDALTAASVWRDDALVCRLLVTKWYAASGERAGVEVTVAAWEEPAQVRTVVIDGKTLDPGVRAKH